MVLGLLAVSLILSCSLVSGATPSTPIGDFTVPDTFTPEGLLQAEQEAWPAMTAPLEEALGAEGSRALAAYAAERELVLADLWQQVQASQANAGRAGLAQVLPRPAAQGAAVVGALLMTWLITDLMLDRDTQDRVSFEEKSTGKGSSDSQLNTTITRDGPVVEADVDLRITHTTEGGAVITETAKSKIRLDVCPDADGRVPLSLTLQWDMSIVVAGVAIGTQMSISGSVDGQVDDDANLVAMDPDLTTSWAQQLPGTKAGQVEGQYAELRTTGHFPMVASERPKGSVDVQVTRQSSKATETTQVNAAKALHVAVMLAGIQLAMAESRWQKGYCLEILVTGVDEANEVDPSSTSTFNATVRHKFENIELKVPIEASLSGDQSLKPTGKRDASVDYTYVAPNKDEATATVDLETRSKRGVAKKAISFNTGTPAWRPVIPPYPWSGLACSLDQPFTLSHTGLISGTYNFTPESATSGTLSMVQKVGPCTLTASGTYTIEMYGPEEPEADITLFFKGKNVCPGNTEPVDTQLGIVLEPTKDPSCP